jgi:pentatricopeptide repeat protein
VDLAEAIFDSMAPSGVPPNVIHYTAMLHALEQGGRWTRAVDLYNQVLPRCWVSSWVLANVSGDIDGVGGGRGDVVRTTR